MSDYVALEIAAEQTGVKFRTLQSWLTKGYLPWRAAQDRRRRLVSVDDVRRLVAVGGGKHLTIAAARRAGTTVPQTVDALRAENQRLTDQLAIERAELADLRKLHALVVGLLNGRIVV